MICVADGFVVLENRKIPKMPCAFAILSKLFKIYRLLSPLPDFLQGEEEGVRKGSPGLLGRKGSSGLLDRPGLPERRHLFISSKLARCWIPFPFHSWMLRARSYRSVPFFPFFKEGAPFPERSALRPFSLS